MPPSVEREDGKRAFAQRLSGEDIYISGSAIGKEIVDNAEVFDSPEFKGGIGTLRNRNVELGKVIAKGPRATNAFDSEKMLAQKRLLLTAKPNMRPLGQRTGIGVGLNERNRERLLEPTRLNTVVLKSEMAYVADQFRFEGTDVLNIRISSVLDGRGQRLYYVESTVFTDDGNKEFAKAITQNRLLNELLPRIVDPENPIEFSIKIYKDAGKMDGRINVDTLKLDY